MIRQAVITSIKRAVIVAHPDDETMWFGGLILSNPGDWTVICCTVPRRDPIRAWKFYEACDRLGAKGRVVPTLEPAVDDPRLDAFAVLDLHYDLIVTHGEEGEYGHAHHKAVHQYVLGNVNGAAIITSGGESVTLPKDIQAKKREALEAYDHVLPYPGLGEVTKHEALLHRYASLDPIRIESYALVKEHAG